jgi:hypothetical protein
VAKLRFEPAGAKAIEERDAGGNVRRFSSDEAKT